MATNNSVNNAGLQFLQEDYKLRLDYLSTHLGRMWQRFNFFIVLESGLSAALWLWLKDSLTEGVKVAADPAKGIALIGLATSLVWYMFGAQDRRLFAVYQLQVDELAKVLREGLKLDSLLKKPYQRVGNQMMPLDQRWYQYFYQWRLEPFSTTKLAAWFPLIVTFYWIGMFIWLGS